MMKTQMIDMARTPKEMKEEGAVANMSMVDKYPYGLSISLDNDCLEKLGLDPEECEIGDLLHGTFMAEVCCKSKHENPRQEGPEHRIELQIKFMSVMENEDEEGAESQRKRFNPKELYKDEE
jgi:hypothetical protein